MDGTLFQESLKMNNNETRYKKLLEVYKTAHPDFTKQVLLKKGTRRMEMSKRFSRGLRKSSDFTERQGCETEVCAIRMVDKSIFNKVKEE